MFWGTFEQRIDEKGRVNVPARFRDALRDLADDRVVVTNSRAGDVRCLDAWPYAEWMKLEPSIAAKRRDHSPESMEYFDHFYLPGGQECQVDRQGRLLVPPSLRKFAGLEKEVVFTGVRGKFCIWDKSVWQPVNSAAEQVGATNPRVQYELGL